MYLTLYRLQGLGISNKGDGDMDRETAEAYGLGAIGAVKGVYEVFIKPEITAKRGWLAVGAVVLGHELLCADGHTLSEGVDKALEKHPVATTLAVGTVALHLLNVLPERLDPIHRLASYGKS